MRKGEGSPIGLIAGFVLAVAAIIIIIMIYVAISDKFRQDATGLAACEARGAQVGGRGECATDTACTQGLKQQPTVNEYAQYLGTQCTDDEGKPLNPPKYCCIILSNNRNPPAVPDTTQKNNDADSYVPTPNNGQSWLTDSAS